MRSRTYTLLTKLKQGVSKGWLPFTKRQNTFCPSNFFYIIHVSDTPALVWPIILKLDFVQSISCTIHQFLKAPPFSKINLVWFPWKLVHTVNFSRGYTIRISVVESRFYYWYRDCDDIWLLMYPTVPTLSQGLHLQRTQATALCSWSAGIHRIQISQIKKLRRVRNSSKCLISQWELQLSYLAVNPSNTVQVTGKI